ncbi:MAG: ABC transporter permease [bacterium]|nr:ABC transporter permease [bacterium]
MSRAPAWRRYLRFWGPDVEGDVRDELDFHLEQRTQELVEGGMTPEAARREAVRLFGDQRQIRKDCVLLGKRAQRSKLRLTALSELGTDLTHGARVALARPVLSAVVILSLALGIGANTAIFTVANRVLIDRLPVANPDELVLFNWAAGDWFNFGLNGSIRDTDDGKRTSTSFSYPAFREFANQKGQLESIFAFTKTGRVNLYFDGEAVLDGGQLVSGTFFTGLGLKAHLGRLLSQADDRVDAEPTVVLAHSFWQRQYGGDPTVIGKPIRVNGTLFTIVGIAEPGFAGTLQVGRSPAVFLPLAQHGLVMGNGDLSGAVDLWWIQVMGRLAPNTDRALVEQRLDQLLVAMVERDLGQSLQGDEEEANAVPRLRLTSGARGLQEVRQDLIDPLVVAFGIAVLILVIACANTATLLLAGAESRSSEVAVRIALGAGRPRVIRQLLTESLMLAVIGGTLGVALSLWLSGVLVALLESTTWSGLAIDLKPDPMVIVLSAVISILTGVVFGLVPALKILNVKLPQLLREGGRGRLGATRSQHRFGAVLIVAQVAVSLVLLIVAGLFLHALNQLRAVDPGFESEGVLTFRMSAGLNGYRDQDLLRLSEEFRDGLANLPGVTSVAMAGFSPITGSGMWDRAEASDGKFVDTYIGLVDPSYFDALRVPLLSGTSFTAHDDSDSPLVAVVNRAFVDQVFDDADVIGEEFSTGRDEDRVTYRIVGMLPDARTVSLKREPEPMALLPLRQHSGTLGTLTYFVRTSGRPEMMANQVREVVRRIDPNVPIFDVRTLSEHVDHAMQQESQFLRLSLVAALLALVLACIGIYATVSYAVSRRTQEIGIRISLGASRNSIVLSAMRQMRAVVVGAAIGIIAAWALSRTLENILFGFGETDIFSILSATILLISVAALAVFIPARRAACVDPMDVLRQE